MSFRVQRVDAADTFPLRQRVLRPHETHDELASSDGAQDACHFAALDHGTVIGSAAITPESPPWARDGRPAWRLRGMATAADRRNAGIGAAVLAAVIEHVARRGGGRLWCNARTPAVLFYERAGFETRGDRWDEPFIGPHIAMELIVEPTASL